MAKDYKTGGRQKGTHNKRTQAVIDKLEALDCDPIEGMARIAQQAESEGDKNLAAQMYKELAPYVAPKRKAIEQTIQNEDNRTRESVEAEYREAMRQMVKQYEAMPEGEKQALMETKH